MESKFIYLLLAGHGGLINGKYVTPGKRSPIWEDGSVYYEGVGNRDIVDRISNKLDVCGILHHKITTGGVDTGLSRRADVINAYCAMYGTDRCVLIEVHSNGFSDPDAKGWEVYSTKGLTKSDAVATIMYEEAQKEFPTERFRKDTKDGDPDKEANFTVIAKSKCRAVLTENFFQTNPHECKDILMKEEGREKIAELHYRAIERIEREIEL